MLHFGTLSANQYREVGQMPHRKEQRRAEAVRKARHRTMVSGSTKKIRDAAGRGLMASAMERLEQGAADETNERKAKRVKRASPRPGYETASAALDALKSGIITPEAASKIAERIEGEVAELKRAVVGAMREPAKRSKGRTRR